ncbi:MAG: hypothetical protein ACREEV_01220, partial [Dongiaceae bacterium]
MDGGVSLPTGCAELWPDKKPFSTGLPWLDGTVRPVGAVRRNVLSDQFLKLAVRMVYFVAAGILLLLALTLLAFSAWQLIGAVVAGSDIVSAALSDIGLLIIAIAVFDVAKFLIEEE